MRRRSPIVYGVLCLVLAGLFVAVDRTIPSQHLVWRQLDTNAPLGFATSSQLMRVSLSPNSICRYHAESAETLQSKAADPHRPEGSSCGWGTARVYNGSSDVKLRPADPVMQCPMTLASHIWLRDVDTHAQKFFGSKLVSVHHAGTYSCRRQVGNDSGQMSEHSFANAWDITGFSLEDGRLISVKSGWDGERAERKFLRASRRSACKIFRVVLSPDYNAAHHDHFHLDMGPSSACG